jgi:hypothetical protein
MATARIARGRKSQVVLADYWRPHWPLAKAVFGSMPGRDIQNMAGLAPEVKATSDNPILGGLRQAANYSHGDLPFVVWRPNGYGEQSVEEWVMAFTVRNGTGLLLRAGYGDDDSAS